jgi:TetR/AcrR family transcriptional repressor of nem operon
VPRRKSFQPEIALESAQALFWELGYDATSISALEKRMGINRFSIYETFGDKKALFLQCLETYSQNMKAGNLALLQDPGGLDGIRKFLTRMVDGPPVARRRGCLMMNSLVEISGRDADVSRIVDRHFRLVERSLRRAVDEAKSRGEVAPGVATVDAARTLLALAHGVLSLGKSEFGRPVARTAIQTVLDQLTSED